VAVIVLAGCRTSTPYAPVPVVDLTRELARADQRPAGRFVVGEHIVGRVARPAISAPVPSRVTFSLPLPRHGLLRAFVALEAPTPGSAAAPVRLRVGVSDDRIYEGVATLLLAPSANTWTELRADLSAYAGWKWSLFYRPDNITWRVVLAADATTDAPATILWGSPAISTDTRSAREYALRRERLR
jgi:hypothetical protein